MLYLNLWKSHFGTFWQLGPIIYSQNTIISLEEVDFLPKKYIWFCIPSSETWQPIVPYLKDWGVCWDIWHPVLLVPELTAVECFGSRIWNDCWGELGPGLCKSFVVPRSIVQYIYVSSTCELPRYQKIAEHLNRDLHLKEN